MPVKEILGVVAAMLGLIAFWTIVVWRGFRDRTAGHSSRDGRRTPRALRHERGHGAATG